MAAHPERQARLLIIRRSWVRAHPPHLTPLTGRETRFPGKLIDQYVSTAEWDVSTREAISDISAGRALARQTLI